jgi:hypothetical protein
MTTPTKPAAIPAAAPRAPVGAAPAWLAVDDVAVPALADFEAVPVWLPVPVTTPEVGTEIPSAFKIDRMPL